jgi:molybdate transport system substrate-binding protein
MLRAISVVLAMIAAFLPGAPAKAGTSNVGKVVVVAAAADAKFAFDEIVAAFEKDHPEITVQVSYGSSGNFYAQLSQRAPFDIFFSADLAYPKKLVEAGFALPDSEFTYSIGKIVLWARTNSAVDPKVEKINAVKNSSVKKIAIANPEHAPYGKAAVAAMQKLGVYEAVKGKLVYGENIGQAAQFAECGAADIGIIALSLAMAPAMKAKGTYWEIPLDAYPRLEQAGVILSWARNLPETKEFKNYVLSEPGKQILRRYGLSIPGE